MAYAYAHILPALHPSLICDSRNRLYVLVSGEAQQKYCSQHAPEMLGHLRQHKIRYHAVSRELNCKNLR